MNVKMIDIKLFNCIVVILTQYPFDCIAFRYKNNSNVFLQYLFYKLSLKYFLNIIKSLKLITIK